MPPLALIEKRPDAPSSSAPVRGDADYPWAVSTGGAAKQRINGRPMEVLARRLAQCDVPVLDREMAIRTAT
jgi:hypothetical protein